MHSYSILTCESGGHYFVESDDQNPNGEDVVKHRGPLYLAVKDSDDYVVSDIFGDVVPPPPQPKVRQSLKSNVGSRINTGCQLWVCLINVQRGMTSLP